ncbi:MAG: pseudaminic acid synthase [Verrucomicrobia bacterium CG_4_10_14_3_um_filter_43_23]|nr:MAG: pseudaminic acid synthase [Verrucomicrobia bacterium CG1_02_43_26]PIP59635.1 MAG: pseudaminic acid synthase [Verrucomicrobia bacterium CG22_combo_CG10-13_8_21_14_all_43_17]PIX58934.1 MAG: pseudaminic acid synthase [Verrucomicrobia bacterium CG_4_10_14_3_um_filter_43_23]PIY63079.1 MAG: pseudaminic acid synthase [Verrucomicrobia bacterium CG_4_10_14_0_8_um_filter_43_34]PJA43586.1 MAG: pseudaminic acid synthase [Verrucomicrobia bacterium CG_4_9_14_3_um_filter_43_20]
MAKRFSINNKEISPKESPFLIAEISGNHKQDIKHAKKLIKAAVDAGADAVKLQTYTPDTLTLPVDAPDFYENNTLWNGRHLYDMYQEGMTPWEWLPELNRFAQELGTTLFSTPFDETAVDYLEKAINPVLYKVASLEINHLPLLRHIGKTQKPVLLSTGMATEKEIHVAIDTLYTAGTPSIVLLKCVSAYPADPTDFNLRSIPAMASKFNCLIGLSDHSLGNEIAISAITLGACVIEKHIVMDRNDGSLDAGFALEPEEFKQLANALKLVYKAFGTDKIGPTQQEESRLRFRRSIFVSQDIKKDEVFTPQNIKIIRPATGLHPIFWESLLGQKAKQDLPAGTPLTKAHLP